jgi:uncharacterized LabA/DUF88 family protein
MGLDDFKKNYIVETELGMDSSYGRILSMIDFGNVNYWFDEDRQDSQNKALSVDQKLRINLKNLHNFVSLFSENPRFYYGHDPQNRSSIGFISAARHIFGKKVFTKQIQKVRHHLTPEEIGSNTRNVFMDNSGIYVKILKCNFDVEMTVDSIRLMEKYETLALFSGDADFVSLIRFLKSKNKKVILFKGGFITSDLRKSVDKIVNAQNIKKHIAEVVIKQKPGV